MNAVVNEEFIMILRESFTCRPGAVPTMPPKEPCEIPARLTRMGRRLYWAEQVGTALAYLASSDQL
jgi:hypothetical protein